jgi:hypothetical protein
LLGITSTSAFAQSGGEPPENVRMRIGPIYINPTLALSNAGVDDNVFNDVGTAAPKRDYTVTVTPKTDIWLRLGPSWLTTNIREDIVYFQKNVDERSANTSYTMSWMIPLNRLTITPTGAYTNTRERPGFEIDTRAARNEIGYGVAASVKALSKTSIAFKIDRHQTQFEQGTKFLETNLHDELNRSSTSETVSLVHQPTPLTTLSVDISRTQDRFTYQGLRNSDATSIGGSIKFDPAALIKGGATVGYQDYRPADPSVPGYRGATAAVNLSYVFLGTTRVAGTVSRQVQYSYDINQPYYVQSGATLEVGQQLFGPLDVVGRGGLQRLDYQTRAGAIVAVLNRVDHVKSYGGGIGYHLGKDTRIGFNIDQTQRESVIALHQYTGLKYGFAVSYGGS